MKRVIAPPPLIYVAAFVPGWFFDRALAVPDIPWAARLLIAAIFIAPGAALAISAFGALRRARTTANPYAESTAIVSDGSFRYTRNPLYVTLAFFYIGGALLLNAPLAIMLLPIALLMVHFGVILREEAYLEQKFGDEYRRYKARVRRWL